MAAEDSCLSVPKISIIVPVYKVEPYLRRCLDSILSQTFTDWECILVDDGSPDASGDLCDAYAGRDRRFQVIHQENGGVSLARNAAMDLARGEWISFVDGDDWLEKDACELMHGKALESDCDVLICGHSLSDGKKDFASFTPKKGVLEVPEEVEPWQGPCAKLFKSTLVNGLRFPAGIQLAEDMFFTYQVYFLAAKVMGCDAVVYHYFQNPESAIHSITEKSIRDEMEVISRLEHFFSEQGASEQWQKVLDYKKLFAKDKWVFNLKKPDCKKWRDCYPSLTARKLTQIDKKLPVYVCLFFHLDAVATFIVLLYRKILGRGGEC